VESRTTFAALALVAAVLAACGDELPDDTGGGEGGSGGTMKVKGAGVTLSAVVSGSEGASKTVVLLHGGPGLSSDYLQPLESLAGGDVRVVRFDQRGMGDSTTPDPPSYTLDDYVVDLDSVRGAVGASRVHLLAHSWGAWIAWAYLAAHPDRVASLIIAGGLSPSPVANHEASQRLEQYIVYLQTQGFIPNPVPPDQGDDCSPRILAVAPAYFHDVTAPPPAELQATQCRSSVFQATYDAVFTQSADFWGVAAGYAGPSFVIFGKSDPLGVELGDASVQALGLSLPDYVVVPASGHYPWLEVDVFETHVRTFLDSLP